MAACGTLPADAMHCSLNPQDFHALPVLATLGLGACPWAGRRQLWLWIPLLLAILGGSLLVAKYGRRAWNSLERRLAGPAVLTQELVHDDGTYRNLIFLHHSVGENLILYGNVRPLFTQRGYQFWDHDYNPDGLTRPDGKRTHTHYGIPGDRPGDGGNTDPEGLAVLFAQPVHTPPDNAFSRLLQHPVVIFKSCFPNNAIKDEAMLARHKGIYEGIREVVAKHPDHVFILLTTPPLHPGETNPQEAARARALATWLQSPDFRHGLPNLYVFGFYDLLADPATNMLRAEYQEKGSKVDSHPNVHANEVIGPQFVDFVDRSVKDYLARRQQAVPPPAP